MRAYLKQIGKVALLNAEEEVELAQRIEAGLFATHKMNEMAEKGEKPSPTDRRNLNWITRDGNRAKKPSARANLRLVVSLAKRYTGRGMAFLDLIQEGTLGLILRSRSSTTRRATSSRRTPRGGSVRPSPARWPTRPARSVSPCTWSRSSTSSAASSVSCSRIWPRAHPRGAREGNGHHAGEGAGDPAVRA